MLYGIIYNWKGLKEENYLYTKEEFFKILPQLTEHCDYDETSDFCEGAFAADKTFTVIKLGTADKEANFLTGRYNDFPVDVYEAITATEAGETEYVSLFNEWYWENVENGTDLFGILPTDTMTKELDGLHINRDDNSMDAWWKRTYGLFCIS